MPRDFLPAVYTNHGSNSGTSAASKTTAAMLWNCLPQIRDNGAIAAYPRPNTNVNSTSPLYTPSSSSSRGRGVFTMAGNAVLFCDEDTYYYDGGSQDLTTTSSPGYAGNTGFFSEYIASFVKHSISGVTNTVIVSAGHTSTNASAKHGNVWYVADGTSAPTSISDADMPGNNGVSLIRGGASLDGYFFLGDITGKIYNSALNDITSWTSTNFLTAERSPDVGVYIGKHHDSIVYIGTESIEFFYNAGNATGTPLARRSDVSYSVGCPFPNSIVESGDTITFVGADDRGIAKVFQLNNFQLSVISTPYVDIDMKLSGSLGARVKISAALSSVVLETLKAGIYGCELNISQNEGYALTASTEFTQFYDYATGIWSSLAIQAPAQSGIPTYVGNVGVWDGCFPMVASNKFGGTGASNVTQLTNGELITFSYSGTDVALTDYNLSNTPASFINFGRWDAGTDQKKRINWIRVIGEPNATTDLEDATARISWTKYGISDVVTVKTAPSADFTASKTLKINARGQKIARVGTGREFMFLLEWLTVTGPRTKAIGLEIDYEIVGE